MYRLKKEEKRKECRGKRKKNSESAVKFRISAWSLFDLPNIKYLQMFYAHKLTLDINIRWLSCANSL